MFYSGQKVTMKHSSVWVNGFGEKCTDPIYGKVYTVYKVVPAGRYPLNMLSLVECGLNQFEAAVFRPVVEPKTDISVFEKLLNPKNHKEHLDV